MTTTDVKAWKRYIRKADGYEYRVMCVCENWVICRFSMAVPFAIYISDFCCEFTTKEPATPGEK